MNCPKCGEKLRYRRFDALVADIAEIDDGEGRLIFLTDGPYQQAVVRHEVFCECGYAQEVKLTSEGLKLVEEPKFGCNASCQASCEFTRQC
jgi:hypothetical protein